MREQTIRSRYWNANGFAVAIVAVVNLVPIAPNPEPIMPFDWACYIGATKGWLVPESDTVLTVQRFGDKLSPAEACAFFPQFAGVPYRY